MASSFPIPSETFVTDHVVGLARYGWQVSVAARVIDASAAAEVQRERQVVFDLHPIPSPAGSSASRWRRAVRAIIYSGRPYLRIVRYATARSAAYTAPFLAQVVRRVRPALIHAHFGPNGLIAAFVARRLGIPFIVDFHGYDVTVIPRSEGWNGYRHTLAGGHAVAHSTFVEQRLRAHLPLEVTRVTLGVDRSLFFAPQRSASWPASLNLLTVGRLHFQKGHHVAIEVLALLRHRRPDLDVRLTICGAGPLESALREQARRLGLIAFVTFTGTLSPGAVAQHMASADVLLVPSLRQASGSEEAFCRVAVEGMASGLAVVGTTIGGLPETIADGGVLVPPGNASEMARAIESIATTSTPESMARAALKRAEPFSLEAMWEHYDRVDSRVLTD